VEGKWPRLDPSVSHGGRAWLGRSWTHFVGQQALARDDHVVIDPRKPRGVCVGRLVDLRPAFGVTSSHWSSHGHWWVGGQRVGPPKFCAGT
jgi:hypothetical protein